MAKMVNCVLCGASIFDDRTHCPHCNTKLNKTEETAAQDSRDRYVSQLEELVHHLLVTKLNKTEETAAPSPSVEDNGGSVTCS
jgi:hypothetical protein